MSLLVLEVYTISLYHNRYTELVRQQHWLQHKSMNMHGLGSHRFYNIQEVVNFFLGILKAFMEVKGIGSQYKQQLR